MPGTYTPIYRCVQWMLETCTIVYRFPWKCQGHIICTGDELKHTEHKTLTNYCWNLTVGWEEVADSWEFPWHWRNKGQDQGCSDGLVHSSPGTDHVYYLKKKEGWRLNLFRVYSIFYFFFASHKICKDGVFCDLFYLHKSFFATKKVMHTILHKEFALFDVKVIAKEVIIIFLQ